MSSNLKVNTILPSTGSNVAIGTAGGTVTMVGNVDIDINSGISTFNDIHVSDKIVHDGDTNTSLRFPAADTITAETGGSERLRITSAGLVGIGTVSPAHALDIQGSSGSFTKLALSNQTMNTSKYEIIFGDQGQVNHVVAANREITFATNGSSNERLRITSTGQLLVGTSSASNRFKNGNGNGATPKFQFETANVDEQNDISLTFGRNNAFGAEIILAKHRAATVGGVTVVQSGDRLGGINFAGSDGTHFRPAALIQGRVDGTPGTADMPGRLEFLTTADGAATPTERLRITSNGDVRVGGGAPATFGSGTTVHETYNANTYVANLVTSGTHQLQMIASQTHGATSIGTRSNHKLNLCANDSTKMTIATDGKVGINTSSPTNVFTIHHNDNNQFAIKSGDANADIVLADSGGSSRLRHSNAQFEVWTGGVAGSYYAQNSVRRLAVTSSGYVQKLNNPSFRAGLSANTTFNSSTDIIFNDTGSTWHYNVGNHYNTSNGRFTAPVSGVYQFNACVIWYGAPNNTFMGDAFLFIVNGGNSAYSGRRGYYNTGTTGNNLYYTDHMSVNLFLNATDYITIRNNSPVTTVHGNTYYTWFAGTFLG